MENVGVLEHVFYGDQMHTDCTMQGLQFLIDRSTSWTTVCPLAGFLNKHPT